MASGGISVAMALKLPRGRVHHVHAGGGGHYCRRSLLLLRLVACLFALQLPLLPQVAAATVVSHLPGFDGPLPFHLETGYVGVEDATGTELFYYFVESERSPGTDAVLLWLSGGPRCSVLSGLALEIGPVMFKVKPYDGTLPQLVLNPNSWTQTASILFVDSPVGSGFSYARDPKGYDVGDISSSMQMVTFLRKWFHDHPQYISNPFYIGGDSYAGKVVPLIALYVSEGNEELQRPLINLKGYLVGNPITGDDIDSNSRVPAAHSFGVISDQLYEAAMKNCEGNYVSPTNKLCADVLQKFNDLMSEVSHDNVLENVCHYDVLRKKSLLEESYDYGLDGIPDEPPFGCFVKYRSYLSYFWANNKATQAALGIKEDKGTFKEWIRCRRHAGLPYSFDVPSSIKYHFNLTTRGYRALVYSGDHDLSVPFCGTQAWIRSFNFSIIDDWRAWHLRGQAAGFTITYENNLTFATIKGGRHIAPENRPEECFAMAQRWLDNKPL